MIEHEVRGRIVGIDNHQMDGVAQRELRAGRKMGRENAGARHLIFFFELDHVVEREFALFDCVVRGDHDRQFDEARRRHGPIGFELIGFAGF